MIIEKIDPSREAYGDFKLEGKVLTIGGIAIDIEEEQEDYEKVITITKCTETGMVMRGMKDCCEYLADLVIPPKKYESIKSEPLEEGEGNVAETETQRVAIPLDIESVILRIWPVVAQEEQKEGENHVN